MEQIKPIKEMEPKERVAYIWEYYKLHMLAGLVLIIVLGAFIYHYATYRKPVLEVLMVNAHEISSKELSEAFDPFLELEGYSPRKTEIQVNSALDLTLNDPTFYQQQTSLEMLIATRTFSLLFTDEEMFQTFADIGYFRDLRDLLDETTLETYKDSIIYGKDEETGETYPCGIQISPDSSPLLRDHDLYTTCCVGSLYSKIDNDLITHFLNYVID